MAATLGMPGTAAASNGAHDLTIVCAGQDGTESARPGGTKVLAGRYLGDGWTYDWMCRTRRTWSGDEYNDVRVAVDHWGRMPLTLNVILPRKTVLAPSDSAGNGTIRPRTIVPADKRLAR